MARSANTYRAARRNLVIRANGLTWPPAYRDANERAGRPRQIEFRRRVAGRSDDRMSVLGQSARMAAEVSYAMAAKLAGLRSRAR